MSGPRPSGREPGPGLERQARDFLASVDDMVYFQGLDGSLSLLNQANTRITGYSPEEFEANPQLWRQIVHPEDRQVAEEFFARYPEGTASFEVEYRLKAKSGEWRWIQSRMVGVRDGAGLYAGYNCIDRDITELKRIQQELREHRDRLDQLVVERTRELEAARQAAEESNRTKTRFLANMSHEIRTPMNAILGLTDLLLKGDLGDSQRRDLEIIQDSAESLLALLDDILDAARIEANGLALERVRFDPRRLVSRVIALHHPRAEGRGLRLTGSVSPEVPRSLCGDPGRLRQVLNNLVGNAVKFTAAGEIEVSTTLEGRRDGHSLLRFEVRDTGIGVAREHRDALFEAFTQGDASTTRRYGGTGLGLAIARQLSELMGGEIGVESEEGAGSVFWFTVRLSESLA